MEGDEIFMSDAGKPIYIFLKAAAKAAALSEGMQNCSSCKLHALMRILFKMRGVLLDTFL